MNQQQISISFLICEDDQYTLDSALENLQDYFKNVNITILGANNYNDALTKSKTLRDNDIISIDSRLPNENDGKKIIENLIKKNCKCLILWHSSTPVPSGFDSVVKPLESSLQLGHWQDVANEVIDHYSTWLNSRDEVLSNFVIAISETFETLSALSILCQGYLAVHKGNPIYSEVEKLNLIDNIEQKQQRTEESEWWQYHFNGKTQGSLTNELKKELQVEKLPSEISNLIDAIYDESITEDKVQKAYDFIVKRLT